MINIDYILQLTIASFLFCILYFTQKYSSNNTVILFSLLTIFSGLSFVLLPDKISPIFGLFLFSIGSYFYITNSINLNLNFKNYEKLPTVSVYFGISLILLITTYTFIFGDRSLGSLDRVIILLGCNWAFFNSVPVSYSKVRDFVFLFTNIFALFAFIPYLFDIIFGTSNSFSNIFTSKFLANPLSLLLNLIGFETSSIDDRLFYKDVNGKYNSVSIAWVCSGIQSLTVFISAFFSYVVIEYRRLNALMVNFLLFGMIVSYLANILRMVIIVIAGHYYGPDALYWTHSNIGWIIFTIWFGIFWHYSIKVIDKYTIYHKNIHR